MNVESLLSDRLAAALEAVAGTAVDPAVRRSQHADFQTGAALPLARVLRRAPADIAAEVVGRAELAGIATAEVSGPGFINLTVDDGLIAEGTNRPVAASSATEPQTVVIDYSAPNTTKEMHVGHLRSTIIGDAAARLLERQGHHVIRANHLGDWGTPFGMLIEHLLFIGVDSFHGDLTAFYQAARAKFDGDDNFRTRARQRVVALQSGDPATMELWRKLVATSQQHFLAAYERMGITLTARDFAGESFYDPMLPSVVDELEEKGLLRVSEGALCAFPAGFTGRDGNPLPIIVRKSDGGFGYAATDLAALRYRVRELGADRLLYVVGTPQAMHFQMVYALGRDAGWLHDGISAEHIGFGSILGRDGKMFRSRSGDSIPLSSLLDEAVERARLLNPVPALAQDIGIGAIKYADLVNDRLSDYVFDWDRMLALTGNTGPYLQYAHARIRSIFDRAGDSAPGSFTVSHPAERALALELLNFEPVLEQVARSLEFHRLAGHLYAVASAFSAFYEKCPVLKAPPEVVASRLRLCDRTAETLREGLNLLGIATPDQM